MNRAALYTLSSCDDTNVYSALLVFITVVNLMLKLNGFNGFH